MNIETFLSPNSLLFSSKSRYCIKKYLGQASNPYYYNAYIRYLHHIKSLIIYSMQYRFVRFVLRTSLEIYLKKKKSRNHFIFLLQLFSISIIFLVRDKICS